MKKQIVRSFKGIWIPKEIWLSESLTLQEKVFLVEISSLDNENGCFASNSYFAKFFGLSYDRVSKIIGGLVEKGLITSIISKDKGNQRILRIKRHNTPTPLSAKTPRPLSQKHLDPISESADHNNIINNKDKTIPDKPEDEDDFVFYNYIQSLKKDKRRVNQIIGMYWEYKEFDFNSSKQAGAALQREFRAAKVLEHYPDKQIERTMEWLVKNADFKWTLESVYKYIDEDLSKIKLKKIYA